MNGQIITLSENTVLGRPRRLIGEWGLSVLVETDNLNVLFDTGSSVSAVSNGDLLGVRWSQIDAIVLSHGHYDHTGGLREVLKRANKQIRVIAHPDIWAKKCIQLSKEEPPDYIGIPFHKTELENLGAQFQLTTEPVWLSDRVVSSGEIPMTTDYETIDPWLCVREGSEYLPDPVADDQALFIKTSLGLVVVLGCAHRGTVNSLRHARKVTSAGSMHTVVGGMHLIRASAVQMEMTIAEIREFGVQRLGVSHCTGMPAAVRLAQEFGENFFFNNAGTVIAV